MAVRVMAVRMIMAVGVVVGMAVPVRMGHEAVFQALATLDGPETQHRIML